HLKDQQTSDPVSFGQLFRRDLLPVTLQTSLLMTMFIFSYYSITFWYATFLTSKHLQPLVFMLMLNTGGVTGAIACGRLAETRLGRRGSATIMMAIGVAATPLFVLSSSVPLM